MNFRCLSSGATVAPRLPHKNFMWNSVRNASDNSSSLLEPSRTISAFLRNNGRFSVIFRADSKWDHTMDKPQSGAEFSQGDRIAVARPDGATVPEKVQYLNRTYRHKKNKIKYSLRYDLLWWSLNSSPLVYPAYVPRMSSGPRSPSRAMGNRCGSVVLGAWGFVHSFIARSVGLSFASKLNASSVCFCLSKCHVFANLCICGKQRPSITPQKPYKLPRAVFVSMATLIHLLIVAALSIAVAPASTVTATTNFKHSDLSIKSNLACLPCGRVANSRPLRPFRFPEPGCKANSRSIFVRCEANTLGAESCNIPDTPLRAVGSRGLCSPAGSSRVVKPSMSSAVVISKGGAATTSCSSADNSYSFPLFPFVPSLLVL